jgi:hypothetical protein
MVGLELGVYKAAMLLSCYIGDMTLYWTRYSVTRRQIGSALVMKLTAWFELYSLNKSHIHAKKPGPCILRSLVLKNMEQDAKVTM